MPPGGKKKPARKTNKKKKGGNGKSAETNPPTPTDAATANPVPLTVERDEPIDGSEGFLPQENPTTPPDSLGYESIYVQYKDATNRFKEGLRSMVPDKIFQGDYVQSLADAVDYLYDTQMTNVPDVLINDLKLAIRVRRRVAKNHHQGGDEGHSYFLSTLVYCFAVLRQLKPFVKKSATAQSVVQEDDPIRNRFAALSMEHDDGDEDDDEGDLPSERVAKPLEPPRPLRLTLDELILGSDREAGILFLMTLDDIMGLNARHYNMLKTMWGMITAHDLPPSSIVEDILAASAVANLGIQYVQFLEQKLAMDYPHMNTIYRLLAVLLLPELTENLTTEVTEKSPIGARFKEADAIMFLGDCLEKALRNPSDPVMSNLTANFCDKWEMPHDIKYERYLTCLQIVVEFELPIDATRASNPAFLKLTRQPRTKMEEGSWLPSYKFIGTADRSILMTTRLLLLLGNLLNDPIFDLAKGFFGKSWDETRTGLAKRISQDMNDLLTFDILPILVIATCGDIWDGLPHQDELLPLFSLLRTYARDPKKSVSWALAFAVHTILTSIFEVQGSNHVHGIAEVAESCFNTYFEQFVSADQAYEDIAQPRHLAKILKAFHNLKEMVEAPTLNPSREQILRGLWNPFCAGNFLGYVAYYSNLEHGSIMVDNVAQLRMILHLYNALKDVGLAPLDSQGFLESLDTIFQSSKMVWRGSKPTRGSFVLGWWNAFGRSEDARQFSDEAAARFARVQHTPSKVSRRRRLQETPRRLIFNEPGDLSKSYRRIVNRDFSDVADKFHKTAEQKSRRLHDHTMRCHVVKAAIYEDISYLAMNLTALGAHLNQFIDQFFHQYWKEEIKLLAETIPDTVRFGTRPNGRPIPCQTWETSDDNLERQAMAFIMAGEILGRLDFLDLSIHDPVVVQVRSFMTLFFNQLDLALIMYFTPLK